MKIETDRLARSRLRMIAASVVFAGGLTLAAADDAAGATVGTGAPPTTAVTLAATPAATPAIAPTVVQRVECYCRTSWRNARLPRGEWADATQQVLVELLERISASEMETALDARGSAERRELVRAVRRVIQRWRRAARPQPLNGHDVVDSGHPPPNDAQQRLAAVMAAAAERLSGRQVQILTEVCAGRSIAEIAQQLELPAERVSDEKYRALRKLREWSRFASL